MDRNQHRDGVAEVGVHHRAEHAGRQAGGLELRHVQAQLGPELVRILDRLVQVHIDNYHPVAGGRESLGAADFGEAEKPLFNLARDLVFHLTGGSAGINGNHNAGVDGDLGVFAPGHGNQGIQACRKQHGRKHQRHLRITQSRANRVHWPPPTILAGEPSRTFC